jgi:hypothetical protein
MYLGRRDVHVDDLAGAFQAVKGTLGNAEQAAQALTGIAPLAAQLSDGLEELQKHKIDVNRLPLKKTRGRK